MELEATPYAEYPTSTRFMRPGYKYFKTVADGAEFADAVEKAAMPEIRIQRQLLRRPATAAPSAAGRLREQQQQPKVKQPEPGWKPIYPEPDLRSRPRTAAAAVEQRPSSPATSTASTSLPVYDDEYELDVQQHQLRLEEVNDEAKVEQEPSSLSRPEAPPPPAPPAQQLQRVSQQQRWMQQQKQPQLTQRLSAGAMRPATAISGSEAAAAAVAACSRLSVAEAVDFAAAKQQQQQPQQHQQLRPSSSRCLRPKTAPPKVLGHRAATQFRLRSAASSRLQQQQQQQSLLVQGSRVHLLRPDTQRQQNQQQQEQQQQQQQQQQEEQEPRSGGTQQLAEAYDKALQQHGWKMEIPGDPFALKRPFLAERKSVSMKVKEPEVKPLPPRMHRTNRFTFFHTTIPRVVMSFDIHPKFTSEQYGKARAALQQQGKWDYSSRDFSFIY